MASYEDALSKMFEERLKVFYAKYDESKLSNVPTILTKYKGKEDQLFRALTQKYGPEPEPEGDDDDDDGGEGGDDDDDDDDDEDEDDEEEEGGAPALVPADGGGKAAANERVQEV